MFYNLIDNNILPFEEYILTEEQLNSYKSSLMDLLLFIDIDFRRFTKCKNDYERYRIFLFSKNFDKVQFLIVDMLGITFNPYIIEIRLTENYDEYDIINGEDMIKLCLQWFENAPDRRLTNINLDEQLCNKKRIIENIISDVQDFVLDLHYRFSDELFKKSPYPYRNDDSPLISPAELEFAQISYLTKAVLKVIFNYDCTDAYLAYLMDNLKNNANFYF